MAPIVIDGLAAIIVVAVPFASLIGLILLYAWFKKRR